jgi:hypothetical protein
MRKIVLLLFPLILIGCEKTFDNVIDNVIDVVQNNYQVTTVTHKENYNLTNPGDSLLTVSLAFTPESEIQNVFFDLYASDNSLLNPVPVEMLEVSNNVYENEFILKKEYPNGIYNLNFTVTGFDGVNKQVAVSSFDFNNGQDSLPPVISNTIVDPDTVVVTEPTVIFTSVEVMDPNGANDVEEVHFIVYKPDSTTNEIKVFLFDDGNIEENGDLVAGDGIYSRLIQIDQTNDKGTYRFEFQAKDRGGRFSNIIDHLVLIL